MAALIDDLRISDGRAIYSETQENPKVGDTGTTNAAAERDAFVSDSEPRSDSESDLFSESDCEYDTESSVDSDGDSDSDADSGHQKEPLSNRELYHQFIVGCEKEGPTLANRGDSTKRMIRAEKKKWIE